MLVGVAMNPNVVSGLWLGSAVVNFNFESQTTFLRVGF